MQTEPTFWQRYKYQINGLLLILPWWFLYQSLTPSFPPSWEAQQVGEFSFVPMPLDLDRPYSHHGDNVKDFYFTLSQGDIRDIRQAYVNIGPRPLTLVEFEQHEMGILHGSRHGLHVHALSPKQFTAEDKLWISVQTWQNQIYLASWPLPETFIL